MKSFLFLLTLAPLFVQTYAGSSFQSTTVLDNNSTGSVELKLDDGKPMIAKKELAFYSFDRETNSHNGARTDLQPAIVQPTQIQGDNMPSRDLPLVSNMTIDATSMSTIANQANKDDVLISDSFDRGTNSLNVYSSKDHSFVDTLTAATEEVSNMM